VLFVCCICRWQTTKVGRKNARNSKKINLEVVMTFFGKFLEKCWHNPQIFKSRYRSRNSSLESRIFWWSLALVILTRSLSRSLGLGYISGRYSDSIERVWGYTSKACKYKKRKRNVGHDDFLLNCNTGCKKHPAYRSLILTASRFSQALLQVSFTNKWWFSSIDVDRAAKGAMPPQMFRKYSHFVLCEAFFWTKQC